MLHGSTAKNVLDIIRPNPKYPQSAKHLWKRKDLMVSGYYKAAKNWIAFDNTTGECKVADDFNTESECLIWLRKDTEKEQKPACNWCGEEKNLRYLDQYANGEEYECLSCGGHKFMFEKTNN